MQNGWIQSNDQKLLFWLPDHNRFGFWMPLHVMVIGQQQTLLLYKRFVHGEHWTQCYAPHQV
ncbi:hypothetical protein GGX14DRAFT_360846 [Mycena pura]|uniref:Uncharacterized protein n=1 Tax=Mycena pura TaxID=153505 RepID=A0AAD6YIW1_9AGAR|nr:hypothetical protein GGX14DRAFT_360846 [Mycena pura]